MTQASRPVGQHTDNYPNGDSGPYSSAQWRALFSTLFTSDPTTQGPLMNYENELAVTNPAGRTIRVATGAAFVNGNLLFNDAQVDFTASIPAGSQRYDRIVACLNESASAYSTSLAFPDTLTDYNDASSIQAYACRLVLLQGAEGGGPPSLVQTDAHYMVPLAQYIISTAGVISSLTDQRTFAVFQGSRTKKVFIQAQVGQNVDDSTQINIAVGNGIYMPNGKECYAEAWFMLPGDYHGDGIVYPVSMPALGGNIYAYFDIYGGGCSESMTTFSGSVGYGAYAVTKDKFACVPSLTVPSSAEAGDFIRLNFYRDGGHVSDTINSALNFHGFYLEYVGRD